MKKEKILIGGGAGLCGSHISRYLVNQGYEVLIIDNFSESFSQNIGEDIRYQAFDIGLHEVYTREVFEFFKPDYVLSLQAMAAEVVSPWVKGRVFKDNVQSLINLLNNCVNFNVKKIIHFSSIAIWAGRTDPPFNEKTEPKPLEDYGLSKLIGEQLCKLTYDQFGLNYSIVRAHNFQGIFLNHSSLYRNFLGIAVREALANRPIPIFGTGKQTRQFSDVSYLCQPIEKLFYTDCPVVNLGADTFYEVAEVANIITKIANKDGKQNVGLEYLPERHEALHAWCDHSFAKQHLGFQDNTDIEKLCNDIYYWVKKQPVRLKQFIDYEITKNLPKYWTRENK